MTISAHLAGFFPDIGGNGAFAVVIALYTAVLGLLVPSGGGKWLVEAHYVMQSATDVQMNLGWTVQIYNIAEALPNLVNPFFMLPLLAVLRLRARDLVGFTFLQFVFHLPVVLLLVRLLGMTFEFVPPVIPVAKYLPGTDLYAVPVAVFTALEGNRLHDVAGGDNLTKIAREQGQNTTADDISRLTGTGPATRT